MARSTASCAPTSSCGTCSCWSRWTNSGTWAKTAEFLSVTQPAVSKMLGEVERCSGVTLFERSTPRHAADGRPAASLVRFARSCWPSTSARATRSRRVESGAAGRTRVGSMVVAMPTLLAPAVQRLKARSPRATVLVEEGDLTHLLPKLRAGRDSTCSSAGWSPAMRRPTW